MKKIIAVVITAVVAMALAVVGVSGAATASTSITKYGETFTYNGSNSWTVTNTANLTSLHAIGNTQQWLCLGQNGVPACEPNGSYTFVSKDFNAGQSCAYVQNDGSAAWDTVPGDPYKSVCAAEPVSNTATATVTTTTPTCTDGAVLQLLSSNLSHASYGTPVYGTVAANGSKTYSVVVTADNLYNFTGGYHTKTLTGTLAGPNTALCVSTPTCITRANANYAYTFSANDAAHTVGGTITVTGPAGSAANAPLCADATLYVRSTTWNYILPTKNLTPSWSQALDGTPQDVKVDTLGTFAYAAPDVTGLCQQHDIYATFDATGFAALKVPAQLDGPGNPYEPAFLSDTLKGKGPNPTYSFDSSANCTITTPVATMAAGECYWNASQNQSFKTATLTYDNTGSNVPVEFTVTGYPQYSKTVEAGKTATESLPASWSGGVSYTVVAAGHSFPVTIPAYAQCPPTINVVIAGDPLAHNPVCSTDGTTVSGYISVIGSTGINYTIHNLADGTVTTNDIQFQHGDVNLPEGSYSVQATAQPGYTLTSAVTHFTPLDISAAPIDCSDLPTHAAITPSVTAVGPVCSAGTTTSGYLQIDLNDGLNYFANGTQLTAAKTSMASGSYTVLAVPVNPENTVDTNVIANPQTLVIAAAPVDCSDLPTFAAITPSVTGVSPVCSNGTTLSGYLQIDTNDGLNYFIGGKQLTAAKTAMAAGTYTVLAVPVNPADTVDTNVVANPMTVVISSLGVVCGDLKTLAFTGGDAPSALLVGAAVLLMFGGALIFTRKRRKPSHSAK
jgi:LPXTG-motif cell wall-anchored protein